MTKFKKKLKHKMKQEDKPNKIYKNIDKNILILNLFGLNI